MVPDLFESRAMAHFKAFFQGEISLRGEVQFWLFWAPWHGYHGIWRTLGFPLSTFLF